MIDDEICDVSDFEQATEALCLLDGCGVDVSNPAKIRVMDTETCRQIVYEGVTYIWL